MFWRVVSVSAMFLMTGCMGMCGPTLSSVRFQTIFAQELDDANRTVAREALEEMGFNFTGGGVGGFSMVKETVRIYVGTHTADEDPETDWSYEQDLENREYESVDEARAEGFAQAEKTFWQQHNTTLSEFQERTGWTVSKDTTAEPSIYIC